MASGLSATLYTIGHGTVPIEDFIAYLRSAEIQSLVDVRRFPGSRTNPQFNSEPLRESLAGAGITYESAIDLGGRRRAEPNSRNVGLRNAAFRAYADYMETTVFSARFEALMAECRERAVAVMCSETLWWRCHRRLIADRAVLLKQLPVVHLIKLAQKPHVLTAGARLDGDEVVYDLPLHLV